jgi:deleted-in-malignant-brain-tumors protein 1
VNCVHTEDAGVICQPHVRLAGSSKYYEGRVEAYKNGTWGTVCDHMWDIVDAEVVCRMLGFDGAYEAYKSAHFGEGVGTIHYNGLQCNGNENRILHCPQSIGTCTHANDAGVRCKVMRLAGGSHRNEGRVELFKNDTWGTVCAPEFSSLDALHMARELSRSAYATRWNSPYIFGSGSGDIKMSNLACEGNSLQDSIFDCPHSEGASQCTHSNDVSIRTNPGVRIYDDNRDKRGAVGVFREKTWSHVCANDWDIRDAHVVCREMRLPGGAVEATKIPRESSSSLPIRGGYRCEGYESNIEDCERSSVPTTCPHYAGIVCQTLRLADGSSPHNGLLQVYKSGTFGGICADSWDKRDAHVACIQLGFAAGVLTTNSVTGGQVRSSGISWITKVWCGGLEKNIFDCRFTWDSCSFSEEVWVECRP